MPRLLPRDPPPGGLAQDLRGSFELKKKKNLVPGQMDERFGSEALE